ncbi:MAG: hypothetical protein ACXVY5_03140 [Gaiellales bacterium]
MAERMEAPFLQLDFVYTPSRDVAADLTLFTEGLGGRAVFAVEGMGTRVAAVALTEGPPLLLLAGHLEGDRPVLVYRVGDLATVVAGLTGRGWAVEHRFEIPHGPCTALRAAGGHRVAVYQLTRPGASAHFEGRRDF